MRLSQGLMLAGALFVAAPALAQDNAAAPANTVTTNAMDANAMDANAAAMTPAPTTTTMAPAPVTTPANPDGTVPVEGHHGFPWGVLGLIGLLGLMGVRKVRS